MAGYVVLYKFTKEGLDSIKDTPERIKHAKELSGQMGIRVVGTWITMGEYDMVSVVDAPDDQTLAARLLITGKAGHATTTTMRAFSEEEFAQIVAKLP
jgi:uncharacterized protein with GYD domain